MAVLASQVDQTTNSARASGISALFACFKNCCPVLLRSAAASRSHERRAMSNLPTESLGLLQDDALKPSTVGPNVGQESASRTIPVAALPAAVPGLGSPTTVAPAVQPCIAPATSTAMASQPPSSDAAPVTISKISESPEDSDRFLNSSAQIPERSAPLDLGSMQTEPSDVTGRNRFFSMQVSECSPVSHASTVSKRLTGSKGDASVVEASINFMTTSDANSQMYCHKEEMTISAELGNVIDAAPSLISDTNLVEAVNSTTSNANDTVEVQVLNLSGSVMTTLQIPCLETVGYLRKAIWNECSVLPYAMEFLHASRPHSRLSDYERLSALSPPDSPQDVVTVQVVRLNFNEELGDVLLGHVARGASFVESALRKMADPNCENMNSTPLTAAAKYGHVDAARLLCESGASCEKPGENGKTALQIAAQQGHSSMVHFLCEFKSDLDKVTVNRVTPLYLAAQEGHLQVAHQLCEARADCEKPAQDGTTPLLAALLRGHFEMVEYLCQARADIEKTREDGATPLLIASLKGRLDVVRCLCDTKAYVNTAWRSGITPLLNAAHYGHAEVVQHLCQVRASLDHARCDGATAMFIAAEKGFKGVVECLCTHGADREKARVDGATPLYIASRHGHLEIVKYLCGAGANLMKAAQGGSYPLTVATVHRRLEVVRHLCAKRADCDAQSAGSATALCIAAQAGCLDLVQFLCEHKADTHLRCSPNESALILAAAQGDLEVVKCLCEHGALGGDFLVKDGSAAAAAASRHSHTDVVEFLQKERESRASIESRSEIPAMCSPWCKSAPLDAQSPRKRAGGCDDTFV